MTKTEWQATRKWCDDLAAVTGMDHETYPTGFIYRDGGEHIEARGFGFGVVIGTTEAEFKTIEEAEDYLWAEWAEAECEETAAEGISVTADECRAYFARMMNSIRESEGQPAYTPDQIEACWTTMPAAERVEWEDEALGDKMDRAQQEG